MSHIRIRRQNNILWLVLDRPPLNILSIEMLDQLSSALRDAARQKPRLIVVMGAGERAFSAGVDVKDHLDGREKEMLRAVYDNCAAFEEVRAQQVPTVALVKGYALGGGCEPGGALRYGHRPRRRHLWSTRNQSGRPATRCRRLFPRSNRLQCYHAPATHGRDGQCARSVPPGPGAPGPLCASFPARRRGIARNAGKLNHSESSR